MKKQLITLSLLALIGIAGFAWWIQTAKQADDGSRVVIDSFEDCVEQTGVIQESYPRRCTAPDGTTYVEDIGNELELQDTIVVSHPRPNELVTAPLLISGEVRGNWYSEGSFQVVLQSKDGTEIAAAPAVADGDWMSEGFVPFSAEVDFTVTDQTNADVIFKKANPSGLAENEESLRVPVVLLPDQR